MGMFDAVGTKFAYHDASMLKAIVHKMEWQSYTKSMVVHCLIPYVCTIVTNSCCISCLDFSV